MPLVSVSITLLPSGKLLDLEPFSSALPLRRVKALVAQRLGVGPEECQRLLLEGRGLYDDDKSFADYGTERSKAPPPTHPFSLWANLNPMFGA